MKQIIREIELSKLMDKPLTGDALKVQEFFDELFTDLEVDLLEAKPDSVFFHKKGKFYMEQDSKNERLWCKYRGFWSFFETEFGLNHQETSDLIKYMVEQQLNCKVHTPTDSAPITSNWVGQQLKFKN